MQAEIDRIKAAGQPLFVEDFEPSLVSDAQNAALLLQQAIAGWNDLAKEPGGARQYLEDNTEPLSMGCEARSRLDCDWRIKFKNHAINMVLPHLSGQRRLARNVAEVAKRKHRPGGDADQ